MNLKRSSCFPLKWLGTQKSDKVLEIMKATFLQPEFCGCAAHFLLLPNNIPLSRCTMGVYPSPTEGHFGCLRVWAVGARAAMDTCVPVSVRSKFSTHLGKYLGMQFLGCMVKTMLSFVKPGVVFLQFFVLW